MHFHMSKHSVVLYLLLIILVVLGVIFFHRFTGLPHMQMLVVTLTALLYVGWGYLHHRIEGDLHSKVMLEYLLIATLAVLLMRGAIYK